MPNPLALLGLARKAGRLVLGAAAVEKHLKQGKAVLLLTASDASPNTARQAKYLADETGTELLIIPYTKETFGRAMGRREGAIAALIDEGFAKAIKNSLTVNC